MAKNIANLTMIHVDLIGPVERMVHVVGVTEVEKGKTLKDSASGLKLS